MKKSLQTMGQHKTFFIVLTFTLIFCFIIPTEKQGNFLYVLLNPSFYNFFGRKKNWERKSYFIRLALGHETTKAYFLHVYLLVFFVPTKVQTQIRWPLHFPQFSNTWKIQKTTEIFRLRERNLLTCHEDSFMTYIFLIWS